VYVEGMAASEYLDTQRLEVVEDDHTWPVPFEAHKTRRPLPEDFETRLVAEVAETEVELC
jgi:hypothetical protein